MEYVKLEDVCNAYTKNIALKDLTDNEGSYPIFGASGYIKDVDFYTEKNDYIGIVKDGAGVGRVNKYPAFSSILGTMQYIIPNENTDIDYLKYALGSLKLGENISGATIPHIYWKVYKTREIPLPPKDQQQKIAMHLDKITEAINNKKKQLVLFDELVKSKFVEMFGDPVTNEMGWECKKLEELGIWNSGGTPSRSKREYFEGNINWYSAGELNSLYLPESNEKITQEAIDNSSAKLYEPGCMLVGMYDTAALKLGILIREAASNQACACIKPNSLINIVWLYFELQMMRDHFLLQRKGVRQKNLSLIMIKNFEVPYIPLPLQNQFAFFVQKCDRAKTAVKQEITCLQELLDSKMQEYFGNV